MTGGSSPGPLVEVKNLVKSFPIRAGLLRRQVGEIQAVAGVSFHIDPGETLGLVGESGSGKSTTGRTLLRLQEPTSGELRFDGRSLTALDPESLRALRREMQMVFQDPYASLNPRHTVGTIVREPLDIHQLGSPAERERRVAELLERVGMAPSHARRFPHEFSGGQRQRIGIARALATSPRFIVADEPISALDVSIQAQIVNLMRELQEEQEIAYLFIAHDLAMVRHISDRVAVMVLGRIVEIGPTETVFNRPLHPYTRALLDAAPRIAAPAAGTPTLARGATGAGLDSAPGRRRDFIPSGELPDPADPPSGCRYRTRCPFATDLCAEAVPELRAASPAGSADGRQAWVACHHPLTEVENR